MTLSTLETAVIEYVGDVITNVCGRPSPEVIRYHGGTVPDDCCTDDGTLSIWWGRLFASAQFPSQSTDLCVGPPVSELYLRYSVCWPKADVTASGGIVNRLDPACDAAAAVLADVADCVHRALIRLSCRPDQDDPFVAAIQNELFPENAIRWRETTAARPLGGCAGVTWALYAAVKSSVPES